MIPLSKFKELIGQNGQTLTDEQLEIIRRDMYVLTDMAFDFWEQDRGLKKQTQKDVV